MIWRAMESDRENEKGEAALSAILRATALAIFVVQAWLLIVTLTARLSPRHRKKSPCLPLSKRGTEGDLIGAKFANVGLKRLWPGHPAP